MWVGGWGDEYRGIISFDLTSLPTTALSATIQLYSFTGPHVGAQRVPMYLDQVTQAWRDTDNGGIMRWPQQPTAQYTRTIPAPPTDAWYSIDITSLYNSWKAGTPNYGIRLRPTGTWNQFNYFWSSDYTNPALRPKLIVQSNATFQSLPNYQHNPADGRQSLRNLLLAPSGQCSFIFGTSEPGAMCVVSSSDNLLWWSPLLHFNSTMAGTEIQDIPRALNKFYRAIYLPTGVSVATTFAYPIGSGDVLEQISPERNRLFPESPDANPDRGANSPGAGWYNVQDVGSYNLALGGIHPGEDWNIGSGTADVGQPIKAVANGQIIGIKPAFASGAASFGYVILVRHWLQNGNSVDSLYVHVAPDTIAGSANSSGAIGTETDFTYQPGAAVSKGSVIGVIGNVNSVLPHLHFEMRDKVTNLAQLWPHDTDNGYYGAESGLGGRRSPTISATDVQTAFSLMRKDGIMDPSDFIDDHR